MQDRERNLILLNGRVVGRMVSRIFRRFWRGYLINFSYTHPDDTRLHPHQTVPIQEETTELLFEPAPPVAPIASTIDKIYIRKSVLDSIVIGAWKYPDLETGEALVGVVPPPVTPPNSEPASKPQQSVYILGTITAEESTHREWGTVQMGDELQYDYFIWLEENWYEGLEPDEHSEQNIFRHLGDWHKQPSGMTHPSHGDYQTAQRLLSDPHWHLPFIIQPIITLPAHIHMDEQTTIDQNQIIHVDERGKPARIDFWYLNEKMAQYASLPEIVILSEGEGDPYPQLAQIPWNLSDSNRISYEEYHLYQHQRDYDAFYFNADGQLPLNYCLLVKLPDVAKQLLIATDYDHPHQPPRAWLVSLPESHNHPDILECLREAWPDREYIHPEVDWQWSSSSSLNSYIGMIESSTRVIDEPLPCENGGVAP